MPETASSPGARLTKQELVREMLDRIADKWTLRAIDALWEGGAMRFSEVQRAIGGVTQKMLTKTLRQMERDGFVTRHVHPEVPPRVEYRLTRLGHSLAEATCALWEWSEKHAATVERARRTFDARGRG